MKAIRLKTEHLFDPIGVDFTAPRLYWNCDGGIKQTAYQIIAADDAGTVLWDSGRVESAAMRGMGRSLEPSVVTILGTVVFRMIWLVTIFKMVQTFEMLMNVYVASWIFTGGVLFVIYYMYSRKAFSQRM